MISPLALAGLVLVVVISIDSPPRTVVAVGLFMAALCYVLARLAEDIKTDHAATAEQAATAAEQARCTGVALAEQAKRHREKLNNQLHGALAEQARQLVDGREHQVERFREAAEVLHEAYGPASEGQRLHAVRDTARGAATPSA